MKTNKYVINDNQKGFLFKKGKFTKLLGAGSYRTWGDDFIEIVSGTGALDSEYVSLKSLLENEDVKSKATSVTVGNDEIGLVFINGIFMRCIIPGEYAFWTDQSDIEVKKNNLMNHIVSEDVPLSIFERIPRSFYTKIEVPDFHVGRLCFDGKFERFLEAGTYYFWSMDNSVSCSCVDTRITQFVIAGQEVMTSDKVLLRISMLANVRITDYERIFSEIDDYDEQIRAKAQLALREYVARYTLDEILNGKEAISAYVFDVLKAAESELYVEVSSAGVRDIILPGDVREILNTVLIAEKKAQASMITRREEVAATRSLLNTAKLMDDNPTLMKLKELEYVERILSNVQSLELSGGSDVASQLLGLVK